MSQGLLPAERLLGASQPLFDWPLRQADSFNHPSYYKVGNFVDQDSTPGVQDYNCEARTYDGHSGTDIANFPFWWDMMNRNQVEVIAAASGTILGKTDGNPDQNCGGCAGSPANAVYVEHGDGSQTWYLHLKSGTLTEKVVGESVSTGEYLGVVGSSGCSTNPHLHFEVRGPDGNLRDPYQGSCNGLNPDSWWASQKPYREPTLNQLFSHYPAPQIGGGSCPGDEAPNFHNNFEPGDLARFGAYYHDQTTGDQTDFEIVDPEGIVIHSWNQTSPNTYNQSNWWWSRLIPSNGKNGIWQFKAEYLGQSHTHFFFVGCPSDLTVVNQPVNSGALYQAGFTIGTSGAVEVRGEETVVFRAGESISLESGFQVVGERTSFAAEIDQCQVVPLPPAGSATTGSAGGALSLGAVTGLEIVLNSTEGLAAIGYALSEWQAIVISLHEITGRFIRVLVEPREEEKGVHEHVIDLKDLESGTYLVRMQADGLPLVLPVVVPHRQ